MVIRLRPERPEAAPVEAEILQREVDLYVRHSEFDLVLRRRENPSSLNDHVRQILAAVTEGKFEETVWEIRGQNAQVRRSSAGSGPWAEAFDQDGVVLDTGPAVRP